MNRFKKIIIWQKPNGELYYKFVKCYYTNYFVGYIHSYDHVVVLIIDNIDYHYKPDRKVIIKRKLINLINKI